MGTLDKTNTFLAGNKIRLTIPTGSSDLTLYNNTPKYCCSLTYKPLDVNQSVVNTDLGTIWLIDKDKDSNNGIDIILPNNPENLDAEVTIALYAYDPTMGVDITTNEPKEKTKASGNKTIYVFANQAPTLSIDSINWTNDDNYPATIVYNITPGLVNPSSWASASASWQSYWDAFQSCFETDSNYIEATMSLVYSSVPNFATKDSILIATTSISNFQINFSIPSSEVSDANKTWYFKTTIQYRDPSDYYNVYGSEVKSDSKILPPNTPQLQIQKNGIKVNVVKTNTNNSAAIQVRKTENNTAAGYNLALYDDTRTGSNLNNNPNIGFFDNNGLVADMRTSDSALELKHCGRNYYDIIVTTSDLNALTPSSISATDISATNASISNATITSLNVTHITNGEIPVGGIYKGASQPSYGTWEQITDVVLIDSGFFTLSSLPSNFDYSNLLGSGQTYSFANLYYNATTKSNYSINSNSFQITDDSGDKVLQYTIPNDTIIKKVKIRISLSGHFYNNSIGYIYFNSNSGWYQQQNLVYLDGSYNTATTELEKYNFNEINSLFLPTKFLVHSATPSNTYYVPCLNTVGCTCTIEVYGYPKQWRRTG